MGRSTGVFEHDRARLLETARREAQRAVETYDHDAESSRLADSVQAAVAGTAALQVGALGLGTIVTILAATTPRSTSPASWPRARSPSGPAGAAGAPRGRQGRAAREGGGHAHAADGRAHRQFDAELERSLQRIREAIAPYTRFVRSERERLDMANADLRRGSTGGWAGVPREVDA